MCIHYTFKTFFFFYTLFILHSFENITSYNIRQPRTMSQGLSEESRNFVKLDHKYDKNYIND